MYAGIERGRQGKEIEIETLRQTERDDSWRERDDE